MTLEDQIRRLGDARAGAVRTPSWRDSLGRERKNGPWLGALAAGIAILAAIGGFVVLFDRGEDGADTLAGQAEVEESAIRRWVPEGDVSVVEYGELDRFFDSGSDIALVGSLDDAGNLGDDWTQIRQCGDGCSLLVGASSEPFVGLDRDDDIAVVILPSGDEGEGMLLASRRFDSDALLELSTSLLEVADISAAASVMAGWANDVDIVYEGPPATTDVRVAERGSPGVKWLTTRSELHFAATYPPTADGTGYVYGLRGDESVTQEPGYWSEDLPVREIDDEKWREIHQALVDEVTEVELYVRMFRIDQDRDNPDEALEQFPPFTARVVPRAGSFTVELALDWPVHFEPFDVIGVEMSPFSLVFRRQGPAMSADKLTLTARLSEWEAESLVRLITEGLTERELDPQPAVQSGACAANPVPADDVLAGATHISPDRTPLDLDQDGTGDELMIYNDADGNWFLVARLQTGWTNALDIGLPDLPGLAHTPEGAPAATDLDGDGQLEFFVTGYLGPSAGLVTLRGCELIDSFFIGEPTEGSGASFGVLIDVPPEMALCEGRACATRVRCTDRVLTQELWVGFAANDALGEWRSTEIRLDPDGTITSEEREPRTVGPFEVFEDPPTEASSGVIDCSLDASTAAAPIARPECAGNSAPTEGSEPRSVLRDGVAALDIDGDGFDDDVISFIDDDGRVQLVLHLGDGNYTNSIPVWFNGTGPTGAIRPGLVATPDGEIAAADLTGDGSSEFFVGPFGNTGRAAAPAGVDGCDLHWFTETSAEGETGEFFFTIGVGGNSCSPTGCTPRVSCVDGQLITEITSPVEAFDADVELSDVEVRWTTRVWEHVDGDFVIDSESETTFLATERPADAPAISDVIDCSP